MSMKAKFKTKCKNCGLDIHENETIYNEYGYWCKKQDCGKPKDAPKPKPEPTPEPKTTPKTTPKPSGDIPEYQKIHTEILEYAWDEARKLYADRSCTMKDIDITAQVFYKKLMDYQTHRGR